MDWERIATKVKAGVAGAAAALDDNAAFRAHSEHLEDPESNVAIDAAPRIHGARIAGGFEMRSKSHRAAATILFAIFALFIGFIVLGMAANPKTGASWTAMNFVVMGFVLVFMGVPVFLVFRFAIPRVRAAWTNSAELHVARWPLRAGQETRLRFVGRSRDGATVEAVTAELACHELMSFRDRSSKRSSATVAVRTIPLEETAPMASPDGSVTVEWGLHMPRDAAASFESPCASVAWRFLVRMRVAGGPDSSHEFELLVGPEVVA